MPEINVRSRYRSSGDVQQRHSDTYVGIRNGDTGMITPYYCEGVEGGYPNDIRLCLRGHGSVGILSPNLILDRPELGLANITNGSGRKAAIMVYGTASRQYKRSLSWGYLEYHLISNLRDVELSSRKRIELLTQFYNDTYPTFSQALRDIKESRRIDSIAFSRRFCIVSTNRGLLLNYERNTVGYISNDEEPILFSNYQHLAEQLVEDK